MRHVPVLLKEVIELLQLKSGMNVIDCTLGDAGHAEAILEKTAPGGKLLGIDLDTEAVLRAKRFLYRFENRAILVRENFANLQNVVKENKFTPVNAVLLDLGWSSPQFEERERGFSFLKDEPLDMRYGASPKSETEMTASEILNTYPENELAKIFRQYGEEKFSNEIAGEIIRSRKIKKIERTGELNDIILKIYREKLKSDKAVPWTGGLHPATKVYQALRMEVNKELENLKNVLPRALEILAGGGRLAVIAFHSLEDRIVKQYFQSVSGKQARLINKKPVIAGEEEININPRSRSAKLRVVEKN